MADRTAVHVAAPGTGRWGDINVTPMVDVMLVLLIVFMVTAPLLTVGVPVDLLETQARQVNADQAPLVVTIREDGRLHLQDTEIDLISANSPAVCHWRGQ